MGDDTPTDSRAKEVKKLVRAHIRVLAHWHDEEVKSLSTKVVEDPMYKPLSPSDLEAEFYAERREALGDIELEPVSWAKPPVPHEASQFVDPRPVEWRATVAKGD
ncbi:hypothetical protein [Haloferax volcanii]|uniref:Uncharacterized protein n=1 Tax=Haloferax volcanii JCM 10717 TaxID=1227458 RepID=M0ICJ4_HALVO|nr:hypothetical protein [Haloferax alexandrinus]ELZ93563.1 hypothetical protein C452_05063 [Haloferax alexandrinus JCM 10717]